MKTESVIEVSQSILQEKDKITSKSTNNRDTCLRQSTKLFNLQDKHNASFHHVL